MKRLALQGLCCIFCVSVMQARTSDTNFYVPKAKKETPAAAAKPPKVPANIEKQESPEAKPEPAPAADTISLRVRNITPDQSFDPPLDPFGLARAFRNRWDFSTFLISADEELKFRLDAMRSRTLRLARAFSALSTEAESRQRNLNSAALGAYLLSRDQHSWTPIEGRSLTEGQMLAVRATMQQDIKAMQSALTDYEALRNSLNASAEEVALMEKEGLSAITRPDQTAPNRPTYPTAALARLRTESVLEDRLVSVEALKATLAAETLSKTGDRRQSIASFAPPPPFTAVQPDTVAATAQPPTAPPAIAKGQPLGESMKQPEKTALVFQTEVNAPVHAVQKGVVVYAGPFRGYGDMIIIEHDKGLFSVHSYLAAIQVRQRQSIDAGTIVGRAGYPPEIGRSGMHFQVRKGKVPIKPEVWLGAGQVQKLLTRS